MFVTCMCLIIQTVVTCTARWKNDEFLLVTLFRVIALFTKFLNINLLTYSFIRFCISLKERGHDYGQILFFVFVFYNG